MSRLKFTEEHAVMMILRLKNYYHNQDSLFREMENDNTLLLTIYCTVYWTDDKHSCVVKQIDTIFILKIKLFKLESTRRVRTKTFVFIFLRKFIWMPWENVTKIQHLTFHQIPNFKWIFAKILLSQLIFTRSLCYTAKLFHYKLLDLLNVQI